MLSSNRVLIAGLALIAAVAVFFMLSATADEPVMKQQEPVEIAQLPKGSPVRSRAEGNLQNTITELKQFNDMFVAARAEILKHEEEVYLDIIENPTDSRADAENSRRRIKQSYLTISALEKRVRANIKELDRLTLKADRYCQGRVNEQTEALCIAVHDDTQNYERNVSTITAMFDVMEKRYEEAKSVLKQ